MALTQTDQLLRIKNDYRETHGNGPVSPRKILDWAIDTGRYEINRAKAHARAAEELAAAMRGEVTRDSHGNEIRVNLAFETEQGWLWDQRDTISREHFELNVGASRRMAYGEIRRTGAAARPASFRRHGSDSEASDFSPCSSPCSSPFR